MRKFRFVSALMLAFGSLLFAQPAAASDWQAVNGNVVNGSVQFDYRGGSATQTLQVADGSTLTITVNNTVANCIGTCVPRPDTWSLSVNGQVWSGNSIETVTIVVPVSGTVNLAVSGKDEGFWGGWYGPTFSAPTITEPVAPAPEPTPEPTPVPVETGTWEGQVFTATAPEGQVFTAVTGWYGAPNDSACGADVSTVLATYLGGNVFSVGADNGVFGDPCGGVVKVLRINLTSSAALTSGDTVDTVDVAPSIDSTDVIEPVIPVVPPVVTPPTVEPAPQPQPVPFPVEPAPQPTPEPTLEPAPVEEPTLIPDAPTEPEIPVVFPEPEPSTSPPVLESTPEVTLPAPNPIEPPVVETVEEQSIAIVADLEKIVPEEMTDAQVAQLEAAAIAVFATAEQGSPAYQQALEALAIIAQVDDAELPAELAAIPLLGDAAGAALETFNAIGNIGADMSPAVREQAEDAVVASVIVGQVASAAASAAVSASAASTRKIK